MYKWWKEAPHPRRAPQTSGKKGPRELPAESGDREGTESPPSVPMGMFPLWCPLSSGGVTGHDDNTSMTRFSYF